MIWIHRDPRRFPRAKYLGLGAAIVGKKGQKTGLYGWFVTSNRTCDVLPTKTEKTTEKECTFTFNFFHVTMKDTAYQRGKIRTVTIKARNVPIVA